MKSYLIILIIFTGFSSCSKGIVIDIPRDKEMPVMNSLITSDSLIYVSLSYSKPITASDAGFKIIEDAIVKLYVDNNFVEELTRKTFNQTVYFQSSYKAAAEKKIRIEAEIKDNASKIIGETIIPVKPEIKAGQAFWEGKDAFGNSRYLMSFSINDAIQSSDYYQLRVFKVKNNIIDRNAPVYFTIENLKMGNGGIFDDFIQSEADNTQYFDDRAFNGNSFTVNLKSTQSDLSEIAIELSAISKETYLYFKSILMQTQRNNDPLYEKVSIYSNIVNGLGIVGGLNSAIVTESVEK